MPFLHVASRQHVTCHHCLLAHIQVQSHVFAIASFYSMSHFSTRVLKSRNLIAYRSCSSILKPTHFIPSILASSVSLSERIKTGFLRPPTGFNPRKFLFESFRAERSMASQSTPPQSVHDFTVKDSKGNDVDLSTYKGKVLVIVNVASQCGLTNSNYTELTQLYQKYKDQGLEILAFPCNQFGSQEPGTNEQIQEFACTRFKAEYPIFDKVDVNGETASPLYKFLKSSKGSLFGDGIKWNFAKFLVDKDGHVVDRYAPTTSPLSFEKDIKKLLEKA